MFAPLVKATKPEAASHAAPTPARAAAHEAPSIVRGALRSPGQPLTAETRAYFEPRFGHDFSRVRVHTDAAAARSAQALGAAAYTIGEHVVFGASKPSAATIPGRMLFAHELTHVAQQSRGGPAPELNPSAPHEQEARAAAVAVGGGLDGVQITCGTGVGVARAENEEADAALRRLIAAIRSVMGDAIEADRLDTLPALRDQLHTAIGSMPNEAHIRDTINKTRAVLETEIANAEALIGRGPRPGRAGPGQAVRGPLPPRPRSAGWVEHELERIIQRGGDGTHHAQGQLKRIRQARRELAALHGQLDTVTGRPLTGGHPGRSLAYKAGGGKPDGGSQAGTVKGEPQSAAKVEQAGATTAQTGAKVEQAVVGSEAKRGPGLTRRLAGKVGSSLKTFVTSALGAASILDPFFLPGPIDAFKLMVNVAEGYSAAWADIKSRNTMSGFTGGLAASLLGLSPEEATEELERRSAARNTGTAFADSAGMAESAFNRALGDGYRYGDALAPEGRKALRALNWQAVRDKNVWALGLAVEPEVIRVFEEARKRQEAARLAEKAQETRERHDRGETGAGMRFE